MNLAAALPLVALLGLLAAACGSSPAAAPNSSRAAPPSSSPAAPPSAEGPIAARVGELEVIHPFLPDPASPAVAAIYLTVRDTGSVADRLVAVSTPIASSTMLMTELPNGTMGMLTGLDIPAHGEASLDPGHDHLMLENPTTAFKVGQKVPATLTFAHAGTVTIEVPVVPLSDITGDGSG